MSPEEEKIVELFKQFLAVASKEKQKELLEAIEALPREENIPIISDELWNFLGQENCTRAVALKLLVLL